MRFYCNIFYILVTFLLHKRKSVFGGGLLSDYFACFCLFLKMADLKDLPLTEVSVLCTQASVKSLNACIKSTKVDGSTELASSNS